MSNQALLVMIVGAAVGYGAPQFEVASVRACAGPDQATRLDFSPDRIRMTCWPLLRLIQDAYDLFASGKVDTRNPLYPMTPVEGLPDWVRSARYSIHAQPEAPQTQAMMRGPMMQRLLEDRFGLTVRRVNREGPVYLMTLPKGAGKLRPAKEGSCKPLDPTDLSQPQVLPDGMPWCAVVRHRKIENLTVIDVPGVTLELFSKLIHPDRRPVINQTGLAGTFDIHLEWEERPADAPPSEIPQASDPRGTTFLSALREQLGIVLVSGRGSQEVLVIEKITRASEN